MDFISYAFVLFTVAAYSQCDISITQSPAITIPDNDLSGIQDDITASAEPSGCFVDSLSITLDVTHSWVEDLHFSLNGFEFFGGKCSGMDDLYVTVTDSSDTPYGCPYGADDVQPISLFADEFGGDLLDVETIWTLSVYDEEEYDFGTLESWTLCITTHCPTTTAMPITTATTMAISTATTSWPYHQNLRQTVQRVMIRRTTQITHFLLAMRRWIIITMNCQNMAHIH